MSSFWNYVLTPEIVREFRQNNEIEALWAEIMRRPTESKSVEEELAQLRMANAELRVHLAAVLRLLVAKGTVTADELGGAIAAVAAEMRSLGSAAAPIEPPAEGDWRTTPPPPHRPTAS